MHLASLHDQELNAFNTINDRMHLMSPVMLWISYFRDEAELDYARSWSTSLMTTISPENHGIVTILGNLGFMRLIKTKVSQSHTMPGFPSCQHAPRTPRRKPYHTRGPA